MNLKQHCSVQTSLCLLAGLMIQVSLSFLNPNSNNRVRFKSTRCHALPSLKPRSRNVSHANPVLFTQDFRQEGYVIRKDRPNDHSGGPKGFMNFGLYIESMADQRRDQQQHTPLLLIEKKTEDSSSSQWVLVGGTTVVLVAAYALGVAMSLDLGFDLEWRQLIQDPSTSFDIILQSISHFDPQKGMLYFSAFYVLAEILAIPAVPILTASSGYLFGLFPGTAVCLLSAAIAASVSFAIGRTVLRGYVERILEDNPKFRSMDRAVEKEGFKLMLLLRLSPLFPFALSNYLYGASSIKFWPYFFGTLLGFAPGTLAYVYAGEMGKALTDVECSANSQTWYVYVAGMVVFGGLLKTAGDVAAKVVNAIDFEE
ncbi:hypothetical protein ACHAWX_000565 [Stephanocyclus meneghinianus]